MPFIIRQTSDHGTANPIVARTSVQFFELLKWFPLEDERQDQILQILHDRVQVRLLTCMEVADAISEEVERIKKAIAGGGIKTQSQGRAANLPQVMRLRERVENYLYNAKSALRDLAGVLKPIFDVEFKEARYDKILEWSKKTLGEDAALSQLLENDQPWIKQVVSMRNAVEHPGGYSGQLTINNFQLVGFQKGQPATVVEPTWHLNNDKSTAIAPDLKTLLWNMLHFTEEFVVVSLNHLGIRKPAMIVEIPEERRRKECPVRFKVTLDPSFMKDKSQT